VTEAGGFYHMVSRTQILDGTAEEALKWLDDVQVGLIVLPEHFDWASFQQMCRDYIRGYYLERHRDPRPDLQPVADKIEEIRRRTGNQV
jgi:hypothetical protein